jgi:hypothetical protein
LSLDPTSYETKSEHPVIAIVEPSNHDASDTAEERRDVGSCYHAWPPMNAGGVITALTKVREEWPDCYNVKLVAAELNSWADEE